MLELAAVLLITVGVAHSYLGERYILLRLFRNGQLPRLFGGTEFTQNTLRFAWHLTTVAWFGFAALLLAVATEKFDQSVVLVLVAIVFGLHFLCALIASRGKHLSWVVFLGVSLLCVISLP